MNMHLNGVNVLTTHNRGFTSEELAKQCADKLVAVSDTAPPAIRDQAHAFKAHAEVLIRMYLDRAIQSDRTTVYNALKDAGHEQLGNMIRRL